jgi:hypothetical protein
MSFSNTLILILCGIAVVFLVCLKSYLQYRNEYVNNASVLPITTPNRFIDNNFEEEKVPDNNLYNVNV